MTDYFTNPKIAPGYIAAASIVLLATGLVSSQTRLRTVLYESQNQQISAYRAQVCRVLEPTDKLVLGAYYYQPSGNDSNAGEWLSEGTYVCDIFGNSGRIERGGYLQYFTTGDPTEMNQTLEGRLAEPANPDHNPALRVRRDKAVPIYQPPVQTYEPQSPLFTH